jgi:hypothetical protein
MYTLEQTHLGKRHPIINIVSQFFSIKHAKDIYKKITQGRRHVHSNAAPLVVTITSKKINYKVVGKNESITRNASEWYR